jgi:hypothetical protein
MYKPSMGDILLWGIATTVLWVLAGMATTVVLYVNVNQIPTTSPTPEHLLVLIKLLFPWAIAGFILGEIALVHFFNLFNQIGPRNAYPIHLMHMSVGALIAGGLLGMILYPLISPPPGAVLRSVEWRIPICALAALLGMNFSLRIIPKLAG